MTNFMINNNNKIILLKELDKNNIISTLIEKGSDHVLKGVEKAVSKS